MTNNLKKLLYVGSSLNLKILDDFTDISTYIFIDTLPRSNKNTFYYSDREYDVKFFVNLIKACKRFGFYVLNIKELDPDYYKKIFNLKKTLYYSFFDKPLHINPTLITFINIKNQKELRYYISTNIQYYINDSIRKDIIETDIIIINETIPHENILQYFVEPKIFIGYINTCFSNNDDDGENICNFLLSNNDYTTSKYFNKYFLFLEKDKSLIECKNLIELFTLKLSIIQKEEKNI